MKCVACKSPDIQTKRVEEEVRAEKDVVLIPIEVLVCKNCGERYYDRTAMRKLEDIKTRLKDHTLEVEEVGKVLSTYAA